MQQCTAIITPIKLFISCYVNHLHNVHIKIVHVLTYLQYMEKMFLFTIRKACFILMVKSLKGRRGYIPLTTSSSTNKLS